MPALFPTLLSSAPLFGRSLANRLAVAPMSRVSADSDGRPTEEMRDYYRSFAAGGFGLVITEGTFTDERESRGYERQPGIATATQGEAWATVARAIASEGAVAIMQLMHAGALAQRSDGSRTIAPSSLRPLGEMMPEYGGRGAYRLPEAMTEDDLESVREGFVSAARRASAAGFHGVEIHAANGYLLDQFITDYTNRRRDDYGGEIGDRVRFPAEVVAAVRAASPAEFVVGVRVSEAKVNDFLHRWSTPEAATIFGRLADAGASYLHVAGEGRGFRESTAPGREPLTSLARRLSGLPVIANGGLEDPELAEEVLVEGHADLIALGRAALANPDWPRRVASGEPRATFERGMISPRATIANTKAWLRGR